MNLPPKDTNRRQFLHHAVRAGAAASGLAILSHEAIADLLATPEMTEGPFYPDRLPLDSDNDLLIVNDSTVRGLGEIVHLSGRALSRAGEPLRNAVVEIWQTDQNGIYLHSRDRRIDQRDTNFQGYGRFLTDSTGRYYFRTIKPVRYSGRTPHIHVAVSLNGHRVLTSQIFNAGEAELNARDGIYRRLSDEEQSLVTRDFRAIEDSKLGELASECDLILGRTPSEGDDGQFPGVVAEPRWQKRG